MGYQSIQIMDDHLNDKILYLQLQMNKVHTIDHLAEILGFIQSSNYQSQHPELISGAIKKAYNQPKSKQQNPINDQKLACKSVCGGKQDYRIKNFEVENQKLEWAGIGFGSEMASRIQNTLRDLADKNKAEEIRFWGVIQGTECSYYVAQGLTQVPKSHEKVSPSCEKLGEGVNYYSFWVCNDLSNNSWVLLPEISPQHISIARRVKKCFTGNLHAEILSQPEFPGNQSHYLKAQLCRMTHSLELAPKGVYKTNDENPKIVEFEEEVKVPEVQELNSVETWSHRNQNILELGRCSHYVDPTLPEDQIEQRMAELAEKDPQVERLRGITEDKAPENLNLGELLWTVKFEGDSQVFTKDEASLVYGVVVLRNIYWPGWVTIGYKNGFTNFYIGNGLKLMQPSLDTYTNADLQEDAVEGEEFPEPNPKELPKVEEEAPKGEGEGEQEG